jgi:tellurite resistance protein TerC
MQTIASPSLWGAFAALVVVALVADLWLMRHGGPHKVTFREAAWWSAGWVALALAFNAGIAWWIAQRAGTAEGTRVGLEFLTGYLVEKSLAVDNIFVFLTLFTHFAVPDALRQRVLVVGVLLAIVLRAVLIFAGALLLARFHWILYVFGAFLLLTGIRMARHAGDAPDLAGNRTLRWLRGHLPVTRDYHGHAFSIVRDGRRWFTPLFLVAVLIGVTDVIFAVDSIPAIFAITEDPFVVLTSNVFAVLGLRAMYFLLEGLADRFHRLPYGLAAVLVFIGAKMLLADVVRVPVWASLLVIVATVGAAIAWSLRDRAKPAADADEPGRVSPASPRG